MKKVAFHNLGCKVNAYETEAMMELLKEAGYTLVPFEEGADVYIINTCTVTNMADRKSRQMLHKARKMNPDAVVVAAGCYTQVQGEDAPVDESIDIVVGNDRKKEIVQVLEAYEENRAFTDTRLDLHHKKEYEELWLSRTSEHTRAYVKVQDGCNQFCSYCIIPFARGRVRSRSLTSAVEEIRRLAANGYQEVVLTGIHLSSYGSDLPGGEDLLGLIRAVHEVEGIERIRLGSLEPGIITEEFVQAIASMRKVCPHFHLSLQSGCNATLKRMNRRYTAEEYAEKCALLRRYYPHPALTTDVIVGFPGETEEEFAESYAFVERMRFYETHIFKYSKRAGTKAAEMKEQIPERVKTERSEKLIALSKKRQAQFEEEILGTVQEILVEEKILHEGKEVWTGHTGEYVRLLTESGEDLTNRFVQVEVRGHFQILH